MIRESKDDTLIVLIDGKRLPQIWRDGTSISDNVEQITLNAPIKESI